MRDITLADTIYLLFTTRAFATGIPTVLAGTPVVSAYENDSLTQITAGITLGVDHDSVVGLNLLTIVATGANGYEAGKDYTLVLTTGTVDSVSAVGEVVGEFSIARSAAAVDLANGTDGLGAIKTDTAAILDDTGTDGVLVATNGISATSLSTGAQTDIYTAVMQTAMVEDYATDAANMTALQALYALFSMIGEFSIAGTTITCKKLDGSTTSMTFTLDDATNPTSRTKAT